eukprot:43302-Chlamydomonas_euryale.AAC.4
MSMLGLAVEGAAHSCQHAAGQTVSAAPTTAACAPPRARACLPPFSHWDPGAAARAVLHALGRVCAHAHHERVLARDGACQVRHLVERPAAQATAGVAASRHAIHDPRQRCVCSERPRWVTTKRQLVGRVLHWEEAAVLVVTVDLAVAIVVDAVVAVELEVARGRALGHHDVRLVARVGEVAQRRDVGDVDDGRRRRQRRLEVDRIAKHPRLEHQLHLVAELLLASQLRKHHVDVPDHVIPVRAVVRAVLDHGRQRDVLLVVPRHKLLRLAHVERVVGRLVHPRGRPCHVIKHARRVEQRDLHPVVHQDEPALVVGALRAGDSADREPVAAILNRDLGPRGRR